MRFTLEVTPRSLYLTAFGREVTIRPNDGFRLTGEQAATRWGTERYPCGTVERWAFGVQCISNRTPVAT